MRANGLALNGAKTQVMVDTFQTARKGRQLGGEDKVTVTGKAKVKAKVVRNVRIPQPLPLSSFPKLDERFLRNEGKNVARSKKLLVLACRLFFVGGGLGKAGQYLLIPRWQQQQQHNSIHPSTCSEDSIWAAAASLSSEASATRPYNSNETCGSVQELKVAVWPMIEMETSASHRVMATSPYNGNKTGGSVQE
jgi:hypothetical protein